MHSFLKLLLISCAFLIIQKGEVIADNKPNFIIYLSDDQDYLDYGIYGNNKVNTSYVDKLASEGLKFTNFHTAQAICAPSRSQLYSGLYPIKNGCYANHIPVKNNVKSVVFHLKNLGYEVVLAGKSHVNPPSVFKWDKFIRNKESKRLNLNEIENYLKTSNKPFCLFVASDYPHGPYPDETKYSIEDVKLQPYENKIPNYKPGYYQNIDNDNNQLSKIIDLSDRYDYKKNTMFIYASDHGISGKYGLYQRGLKIPFIIRWPGVLKENTNSNSLLTIVDVLPTLVEIAGGEPKNFDGNSFLPILKNEKKEVNDYIFGVSTRQNVRHGKVFPSRMISNGNFKLIVNFNSIEVFKKNLGKNENINKFIEIGAKAFPNVPYEELYDLKNDPHEKINLAKNSDYKELKRILTLKLKEWMINQHDFLLNNSMPLLKPTLHPLDKISKWNDIEKNLVNTIKDYNYLKAHY